MDAFYASVEQRDFPELRGKPIAVGGSARRGVVASASYEARRYGVRSAMPSVIAARKCPDLVFVKHRFDVYREVSNQIREIFLEYTDLVEPLSLDEAYLDITEPKIGPNSATLIAEAIRAKIYERTQLTASAGVSFNKFLAKVASDINKPNGIKVILPHEANAFLEALPIQKFHGIGKVTAKKMLGFGLKTGKDLKAWSEIQLVQRFGKAGRHYFNIVRANDNRAVNPNRIRKSIGAERTFSEDISDLALMKEKLRHVSNVVFEYMQARQNFGRTITLKAKTHDFKLFTRSKSYQSEVRTYEVFWNTVEELIDKNYEELGAVRLLGVASSNLEKENQTDGIQLELDFGEPI